MVAYKKIVHQLAYRKIPLVLETADETGTFSFAGESYKHVDRPYLNDVLFANQRHDIFSITDGSSTLDLNADLAEKEART